MKQNEIFFLHLCKKLIMFRSVNQILILCIISTTSLLGQPKEKTTESRACINKHISYLNYCADYISVLKVSLEDYNNRINTYYNNENNSLSIQQHIPFKIENNEIPEALKWQAPNLKNYYSSLKTSRAQLDQQSAQILEHAINKYQKHFKELLNSIENFTILTNNTNEFYKDDTFKDPYKLILSIEKSIEKLTHENDLMFNVVLQLFGDEELPETLERSKHIAFIYKKMIQEFRSEKKENLPTLLAHFKRISDTKNTSTQYKTLANFGNYAINDSKQILERDNIELQAKETIKLINSYLNNELAPCDSEKLESYGSYYCWLNKINTFNDNTKNTIGNYNSYAIRAKTPVLLLIQELQPFKVFLPKNMMYLRQETKLKTSVKDVADTGIKTIDFNKEDISSLQGALDNNLVLLLDISASMRLNNNEEKLKKSITHLIDILRPNDQLTIISYSGIPKKILETSTNYNKEVLKERINTLKSNGNTDANAGLKMAYRTCLKNYSKNKNNKIIIASDGGFWVNNTIKNEISKATKSGIALSTFHYLSKKEEGKKVLKELASIGNGNYKLIKVEADAIYSLVYESKQQ